MAMFVAGAGGGSTSLSIPAKFSPSLSSDSMTFKEDDAVCVSTHPSNSRAIVDCPMQVPCPTQTPTHALPIPYPYPTHTLPAPPVPCSMPWHKCVAPAAQGPPSRIRSSFLRRDMLMMTNVLNDGPVG